MDSIAQLLTEQTVVLVTLTFVLLVAFLYCWGATGSSPFMLMKQIVEEGKNKVNPEKEKHRESQQEKRIKAAPPESISMTGGVGTGTVSEVLAQQTSLLLQDGVIIQDDFTTDLVAGHSPAIEELFERTDNNDRE